MATTDAKKATMIQSLFNLFLQYKKQKNKKEERKKGGEQH